MYETHSLCMTLGSCCTPIALLIMTPILKSMTHTGHRTRILYPINNTTTFLCQRSTRTPTGDVTCKLVAFSVRWIGWVIVWQRHAYVSVTIFKILPFVVNFSLVLTKRRQTRERCEIKQGKGKKVISYNFLFY